MKKPNHKISSHHPCLHLGLNFPTDFFTSSPWVAQKDGEGGLWSVHHVFSLPLLPLHLFPLLQHGDTPTGDRPPQTSGRVSPPHWAQSLESSALLSVFHDIIDPVRKLLQCGFPCSWGHRLPGACSSMDSLMKQHFFFFHRLQGYLYTGAWRTLPQLLHCPWCVPSCSSHLFLLPSWATVVVPALFPHLSVLSQRCYCGY